MESVFWCRPPSDAHVKTSPWRAMRPAEADGISSMGGTAVPRSRVHTVKWDILVEGAYGTFALQVTSPMAAHWIAPHVQREECALEESCTSVLMPRGSSIMGFVSLVHPVTNAMPACLPCVLLDITTLEQGFALNAQLGVFLVRLGRLVVRPVLGTGPQPMATQTAHGVEQMNIPTLGPSPAPLSQCSRGCDLPMAASLATRPSPFLDRA
mmetsp:Transcript_28717/g.48246  ORF Transcript_28717/g.48246 Transcript_28717/m.48246 type:complete len:210 (+) Transcript_28717:92-721(+)